MDKLMSQKEMKRRQILYLLEDGKISQQEAAKRMEVSPRQVRRLLKRYHAEGLCGLASKKHGNPSNRRLDETLRWLNSSGVCTLIVLAAKKSHSLPGDRRWVAFCF